MIWYVKQKFLNAMLWRRSNCALYTDSFTLNHHWFNVSSFTLNHRVSLKTELRLTPFQGKKIKVFRKTPAIEYF